MIRILKNSIIDIKCDAIVNAANEYLAPGSGVCGVIFQKAGYEDLQKECIKIGHCDTGKAVITKSYNLDTKYIIHAVGPIWKDGHNKESQLLKSAYSSSLNLAIKNGCKSIAFPLISSGIFGYPVEEAWKIALETCCEFNLNNQLDIYFAIIDDYIFELGHKILEKFQ